MPTRPQALTSPRRAWVDAELFKAGQDVLRLLPDERPGREAAERYLAEARATRDVDAKWQYIYGIRELLIPHMAPAEIASHACALKELALRPGDLGEGRYEAVLHLLDRLEKLPEDDPRRAMHLAEAVRIRYEGYANQYRRLTITHHYQFILLVWAMPTLIATFALLVHADRHFGGLKGDWARTWPASLLCLLLGALGALTSAAQRSTRIEGHRIHEQLGSYVNSNSRWPLGAVAGLTVWLFSLATADGNLNAPNMLLIAFGAGFAERLIVQTAGLPGGGSETSTDQPGRIATAAGLLGPKQTDSDERNRANGHAAPAGARGQPLKRLTPAPGSRRRS